MKDYIIKGTLFLSGVGISLLNPFVGGAIILSVVGSYAFENFLKLKADAQDKHLANELQKETIRLTAVEQEKLDIKLRELSEVVVELKKLRVIQEPVIKTLLESQSKVRQPFNNFMDQPGL